VATTVAADVFSRVEALMASGAPSRAEAIRRVARETGRSVSATSSAYYAAARRTREAAPEPAPRTRSGKRGRASGSDAASLYAEMLPLVEAGATVEQAARRFGDEDSVPEIAAGFSRWLDREGDEEAVEAPAPAAAADPALAELDRALRDAQGRITALEAENRELRRELTRARQAITRVRTILDSATS
jgi:hypothetical protein